VYTGTSLIAPERVIRDWRVAGVTHGDIATRSRKYMAQNGVHLLPPDEINENNQLFVHGCAGAGYHAEQFPLNLRGCLGASVCNLGCPNQAKQGTNRVQLPAAELAGVEVVTRAEVATIEDRAVRARVREKPAGAKGRASEWAPGDYRIRAATIVLCGGSVGTTALMLRSRIGRGLRRLGEGFTCHPAHILVGEHDREITNDVGHPKSYYLDRAESEGYVLETCMYFPFTTAKNLTGFGEAHSRLMRAFPRLQMILVLACDKATPGNRIAVDRAGRPVVHYTFTPAVIASLVRATRASARIFFAAGARRVHAEAVEHLERGRRGDQLGRGVEGVEHRVVVGVGDGADVLDIDAVDLCDLGEEQLDRRAVGQLHHQLIDGLPRASFEDVDADDVAADRTDAAGDGTERTGAIGQPHPDEVALHGP